MQRASHLELSSDPRQRTPPAVVSLGVSVAFVATVTLALATVTAPWLVGAFLTGLLSALTVRVVRRRLSARDDSESPFGARAARGLNRIITPER